MIFKEPKTYRCAGKPFLPLSGAKLVVDLANPIVVEVDVVEVDVDEAESGVSSLNPNPRPLVTEYSGEPLKSQKNSINNI